MRFFVEFFWFGAKYHLFRAIWCILSAIYPKDTYLSNVLINNGYGIMHRKDSVFPLSTITFEGKDFPAPGNVDAYLKDLYKNYMDIPPKEKQIVHACYIHPELKPLP
jgi:lipopolysaccharide cholinephosphotransferase